MALIGIWDKSPIVAIIGATGIFLSACYSVFLFNRLSFGTYSPYLSPLKDISRREYNLLITLLVPTVVLGIWPNIVLDSLHTSVSSLLYLQIS